MLPELPEGTPLTGADAGEWAVAILRELDAPRSKVNCFALAGWFHREGGGGRNNPMNTTLRAAGATGAINSAGVENYDTPEHGVAATVRTLHGYPAIVLSLRDDRGLTGPNVAGELHEWSGGGYTSITPIMVPLPPTPAAGTFKAALAVNEHGKWFVHGVRSPGVRFGGPPDEWWRVEVFVNRATGEWRTK